MTRWALALAVLPATVPDTPGRDEARHRAQQELSRPEYQRDRPGFIEQLWNWLDEHLRNLQGTSGGVDLRIIAISVVTVAAIVLGYALWRAGGVRRRARAATGAVLDDVLRRAADHLADADAAEQRGDHWTAVVERFRGIVAGLGERTLIVLTPGLTADEAARSAAGPLPELAVDLAAAARLFDDVRYGGRAPAGEDAAWMRDLAARTAAARPVLSGTARPESVRSGPVGP